jgi:transposase
MRSAGRTRRAETPGASRRRHRGQRPAGVAALVSSSAASAELDLPAASREIITDCLAVIDGLAPVIDRIDGELHQHAKADPRVKVLRTLPGVGEFTTHATPDNPTATGAHRHPARRSRVSGTRCRAPLPLEPDLRR